ncbi:hypothetical protein Hanom_Chr17g01589411 [Helianthus anomalus]
MISLKSMRAAGDLECGAALGRHVAQHTADLGGDRAKLRVDPALTRPRKLSPFLTRAARKSEFSPINSTHWVFSPSFKFLSFLLNF